MEYLGHSQTAQYMTGPYLGSTAPTFLPDITRRSVPGGLIHSLYDSYPGPSPLRRSLTSLPWKPSVYYQTAKVKPTTAISRSMPEPLSYESRSLTNMDAISVPPLFAGARNGLYTRYSPGQWQQSNMSNYSTSDRIRNAGERLRIDAVRLCNEADDKTRLYQEESGKKLGDRVRDISFWETELKAEKDRNLEETDKLMRSKQLLELALKESENPLQVAQECLYEREKRQAIDLVHDEPEQELIREVDNIKLCQERMRQLVNKSNMQLSANRAAQHELERDIDDKHSARNIDSTCHNLRDTSRGINFHNGIERVDNTISIPGSWAKFSADNIQRSQSERAASKNLRNDIDKDLETCIEQMWRHWNNVNEALTRRIQDSTDARNKLQKHLSKVIQEIFDMEKHIALIKKTVVDKEGPLKVAQTRLRTRGYRPNIELCRDDAQHRLVEEVHGLFETVDQLQNKLREAENALQFLLQAKSTLEQDLAIKNNSLFIDEQKCLSMRKAFPMTPKSALIVPQ